MLLKPPRKSPRTLACRKTVRHLKGQDIIIGLSGGADSTALTLACALEGVKAHCVVVDHGLQEASHDASIRAVNMAQQAGLTAEIVTITVEENGEGTEAAARKFRYQALARVAHERGDVPVAVAHTQQDQAETLIINSLRGNALGMLEEQTIFEYGTPLYLIRPMLHTVTREDTKGMCKEMEVDFWDDPMNEDEDILRVALRKKILPLLSEVAGRDVVSALSDAATKASYDTCYLDRIASRNQQSSLDESILDIDDRFPKQLDVEHEPIVRRVVINFLKTNDIKIKSFILDGVYSLIFSWHGQQGIHVVTREGTQKVIVRKGKKILVREK